MKRSRQAEQSRLRNAAVKSQVRTATKSVLSVLETGGKEEAQAALALAIPKLDKAAGKGVLPKKTISRKISRLTQKVNALK
jgi:small subunit ribosomal protein S20